MDKVFVRFLFGGNLFFNVSMERKEALSLIEKFRVGALPAMVGDEQATWAIRTSSIHAVHLAEEQPPQQTVPGFAPGGYSRNPLARSGI